MVVLLQPAGYWVRMGKTNIQTSSGLRPRHYRASRRANRAVPVYQIPTTSTFSGQSCFSLQHPVFSLDAITCKAPLLFLWYGHSKTGTGPMPQLSCADPELSGIPSFLSGRFQTTKNWAFVNTHRIRLQITDTQLTYIRATGDPLSQGEGANPSTLRRKVPTSKPPYCLYRMKLARFEAKSGLLLPSLGPANSGYSACSRQLFVVDFPSPPP